MARQKLGQHFLTSGKILQRIAAAASAGGKALVVEIGPGKGALTQYLLQNFDRVVAVELDAVLAQHVRERWQNEPRLEVVERNALGVKWGSWGEGVLAGNLPYYISTALISNYVRAPGALSSAVFLIQKEVAERITATPGNREYGYLTVECQLLAKAEYLFNVPPGAFQPPPKVDSSVIRLTPIAPPASVDIKRFLGFVSICFHQKRKTLRNNLSGQYSREILDTQPEIGQRAEQLSIAQFLALYQTLQSESSQTDIPER